MLGINYTFQRIKNGIQIFFFKRTDHLGGNWRSPDPFGTWKSELYKKIANLWGKSLFSDDGNEEPMALGGSSWFPSFKKPMVELEEDANLNDDSFNLNDIIQKELKKLALKEPEEHDHVEESFSRPPGFENFVDVNNLPDEKITDDGVEFLPKRSVDETNKVIDAEQAFDFDDSVHVDYMASHENENCSIVPIGIQLRLVPSSVVVDIGIRLRSFNSAGDNTLKSTNSKKTK
ncbi:hypothetical protein L1987_48600 [Smallanthus sonchifolius]|uniref:Uncharacterized protein n=1 Tax=Smallanthus sonchifolius TaxID=185202 RepID=A0ACB9FU10_9ASTR|nr:hypothetical protein L1987_48600 [Smallanthus sonchifolius]